MLDMLCFQNSFGLGGELVHNQQGNIICLDILTCYDTSSKLLVSFFVMLWCWLQCLKVVEWDRVTFLIIS